LKSRAYLIYEVEINIGKRRLDARINRGGWKMARRPSCSKL